MDARRRTLAQRPRTPAPRIWTESEQRFLVAASEARVPIAEIARRLGRSRSQVRHARRSLAVARAAARPYAPADDRALSAALAVGAPLAGVAAALGRSEGAVRLRARALGVLESPARPRWSPAEDRKLRHGYRAGLSARHIRRTLLPARSEGAIVARARLLGVAVYARRWSRHDEERLRQLSAEGFTARAASELLGRSSEAVAMRARRLGQPMQADRSRRHAAWTAAEDDLLRRRPHEHVAGLARQLDRSEAAIRRRRRVLDGARPAGGRTQHHPYDGEQAVPAAARLIARHAPLTPARALSLSRRLGIPLGDLQRLARRATANHATPW